jgi:hypothetical protein
MIEAGDLIVRPLLLYDPARRPPDWNEHLAGAEVAVFLSDVRTDAEVTVDGGRRAADAPAVCLVFDNHDAAAAWCRERVGQIEHLRAELYDRRGMAPGPIATFVNPKYANRLPSRRRAKWMMAAAIACPIAAVPLFWLDYTRGGALVVPTFLGFSLLVTGVRLAFFGWAELRQAREHEREQAGY